ncbi:hypothetical protein CRG98_017911 [Punica granatum]|uniref:RRM domain-containing protein n=1 Tax=Punica granatum TaxID=22663 RepID=A0A2I0JZD0_PUNGR|nr:hypothetical protein CRG98_017911 [Punica granatum]
MSSALDMSLDDLIKNNKKSGSGNPRARGRGSGGPGPARRPQNRAANRAAPYAPAKAPETTWQHDMYSESSLGMGFTAQAGRASAIETGTKLYISNLDYGVSNDDVKELFAEVGDIKRYSIHYDRSGRSKAGVEVPLDACVVLEVAVVAEDPEGVVDEEEDVIFSIKHRNELELSWCFQVFRLHYTPVKYGTRSLRLYQLCMASMFSEPAMLRLLWYSGSSCVCGLGVSVHPGLSDDTFLSKPPVRITNRISPLKDGCAFAGSSGEALQWPLARTSQSPKN